MNAQRIRRPNWSGVGGLIAAGLILWSAKTPPEPALRSQQKSAVPVPELHRGPRGAHRVAVTFDAGGEADAFPALLAALDHAQVRSAFFLTGEWMSRNPDLVRLLVSSGHELGNHTWSHRDLTQLEDIEIRNELSRTEALLAEHLHGQRPTWWRAPFGSRNARVLRVAGQLGYASVYWTIDSLDSVPPQKTPGFLVERIAHCTDRELDGAIILMHVGEESTATALPQILRDLQRRGFQLVTISALVRAELPGTR